MSVDVSRIGFSQKEYRSITVSDPAVKVRHPMSVELTYNTLLSLEADAQSFGSQVLSLRKLDRWNWICSVVRDNYPTLSVGKTIRIVYPRFDLQAGKNFIIKKVGTNFDSMFTDLELFGPEA